MCRNLFAIVMTSGLFLVAAPSVAQSTTAALGQAELPVLQPARFSERNQVSALPNAAPAELSAGSQDKNGPGKTDSGWKYLTTLFTTVVLIGVIAVRRHSGERH